MVVTVRVPPEGYFLSNGLHFLRVEEVLTEKITAMGLTPQRYVLPFRVVGQGDSTAPGQR